MALNVLFVHEFGTPTAAEQAMIDLLEGRGDSVTGQNEGSATNPWPISPGTYDVIILGESANNIQDWPGLVATTDPILTVGIGFTDLNLCESGAGVAANTNVNVVDDEHPIAVAAGLSDGSVAMYDPENKMDGTETPAAGAVVIIEDLNVSGRAVLAAYDQGATLTTGTAAGRRVIFGFEAANSYTALGEAIFLASVDWAADALSSGVSVGDGTLAAGDSEVAGTGVREVTGTGTAVAGAASADGTGTTFAAITGTGTIEAQAAAIAGSGVILSVRNLVLTAAQGRELRDHENSPVELNGIIYEWYDDPDDTDGNPTDEGTFNTDASGEATVVLTNSALSDGSFGGLVLRHPSDNTIRGYYRIPVTLTQAQ